MAGGAETPNIAALPAIARLGACESARGPDAGRHVKLLIQFAVKGLLSGVYPQRCCGSRQRAYCKARQGLRDLAQAPITSFNNPRQTTSATDLIQHVAFLKSLLDRFVRMALAIM